MLLGMPRNLPGLTNLFLKVLLLKVKLLTDVELR